MQIKKYLKNFILAQLIITVVLIPILVHWGLELSLMSFVGNFIFTPFLAIFLMLSTLVFFTELFGIYNQPLIFLLNKTTIIWDRLLSFNNKSWLTGFVKVPISPLILITITMFLILKHKRINSFRKQIITMTLILAFMIAYLKLYPIQNKNTFLFDEKISISKDKNKNINLIDNGFFNKTRNAEKVVEFELKPFLVQKFGTSKINNLTLKKISKRSFNGALQCSKILNLKKITIPFFKESLDKSAWRSFFLLRNFLSENKIEFMRTFN